MYFQPCRKKTLYYSVFSSSLLGLYNVFEISLTGGLICFIAIANTIFQIYSPISPTHKNRAIRLSIAMMAALFGTAVLAQSQADYLPMMAFIIVCFAETATRQDNIYKMYVLSVFMWVMYPYIHGDMAYAALNSVLLMVNIIILNKTYRQSLLNINLQRFVPAIYRKTV